MSDLNLNERLKAAIEAQTRAEIARDNLRSERDAGVKTMGVVYIAEGSQLGYLPGDAVKALGWWRDR